ncbi:hypothetical protein N7G274_005933 [Stereocaulon virgatum]|uniref:Uncharacterized protein n=1 Tax=Stereocaulon virgatum TaxID=373712 RepID=A0ABR4A9H6_9LECA
MFDPKFHKVDYCSAPNVVLVGTRLRCAWRALPWEDISGKGVGQFMKVNHEMLEEERERVPQNPDRESLHTPWRDSIYHLWNHVFYDVMKFLPEVGCSVGYFHPPSHDAFTLDYRISKDDNVAVENKGWNTNVLLIPAHRRPGVIVRATVNESQEEGTLEKELRRFDASNLTEIWYVRKGVHVTFYIEGDPKKNPQGVAAVTVCGILCSDIHESVNECCEIVQPAEDD